MLNSQTVKKIEDFVYAKPRSIQEVALHIQKNWRTADRYIEEMEREYGTVATRVFREGTRGALKVAYWASIEKASANIFQEQLEQQIFSGRNKFDFSPFDIFQHVASKDKNTKTHIGIDEVSGGASDLYNLKMLLESAEKQL